MKIGTLTIKLNEIGGGGNAGVSDGFATKEFKIHQSVTAANWNVSDNVEVVTGAPTETLTNEQGDAMGWKNSDIWGLLLQLAVLVGILSFTGVMFLGVFDGQTDMDKMQMWC